MLFCRPTPPWPSQDSLASCKFASAVSVHPGYLICALINTLFARSAGNRYVILLLFAMNVVLGLPTSAKFTGDSLLEGLRSKLDSVQARITEHREAIDFVLARGMTPPSNHYDDLDALHGEYEHLCRVLIESREASASRRYGDSPAAPPPPLPGEASPAAAPPPPRPGPSSRPAPRHSPQPGPCSQRDQRFASQDRSCPRDSSSDRSHDRGISEDRSRKRFASSDRTGHRR